MARCAHCGQRKGKRACPALAAEICSACCGKHRRREIACPEGCQFLPSLDDVNAAISRTQTRIIDYALNEDEAAREASDVYLGARRELADHERGCFAGWLAYGHERSGERAVERFRRLHSAGLREDARAIVDSLVAAWPGYFEVVEVVKDEGVLVRDVLTGETVRVREKLFTHQARRGTRLIDWIMELDGVAMLVGSAVSVPPAHAELVERTLREAIERERAKDGAVAPRVLFRRALGTLFPVFREAVARWVPPVVVNAEGMEVGQHRATYEVLDVKKVRAHLEAQPGLVAIGPDKFTWLDPRPVEGPLDVGEDELHGELYAATDAGTRRVLGQIELRTVRLTLETLTAEYLELGKRLLERQLGPLLRHRVDTSETLQDAWASGRLDRGRDDDDRATRTLEVDHDPGATLEQRHAKILAELERLRLAGELPSLDERPLEAPRPAPDPGSDEGRRLPPLAHEALYELVPGLEVLVREEARALRAEPGWELRAVPMAAVAARPAVLRFVESHARSLVAEGQSVETAVRDSDLLGTQLHAVLNHEVHRRKTFWLDEALAWALLETELDIEGACLRLPFPAAAFVFSDRGTLELAESFLALDQDCPIRRRPLELVTVYVSQGEGSVEDGQELRLAFFFDTGDGGWPYLISRDLFVRPKDDLATILDSHVPGVRQEELDPIFLAPELLKLIHLVVSAILYSTSAHLERVELPPSARRARRRATPGQPGEPPVASASSADAVYFLPGKIPISRITHLRQLDRTESGRAILKRFMVRGHWRRPSATWKDQALRWIEPYWKGPDLAAVIEREYRLEP